MLKYIAFCFLLIGAVTASFAGQFSSRHSYGNANNASDPNHFFNSHGFAEFISGHASLQAFIPGPYGKGTGLNSAGNRAYETAQLGGRVFEPGVYHFQGAEVTGKLTLKAKSKADRFIFIIAENLVFQDKALNELKGTVNSENITWQTNGQVKIGRNAKIAGNIYAAGTIAVQKGAKIKGQLFENNKNRKPQTGNSLQNLRMIGSDLVLTKTAPNFFYAYGDTVTFRVFVKNAGTNTESKAFVLDILDNKLIFLPGLSTPVTSYNSGSRTITYNLPVLQPNDTAVFLVSARVNGGGYITNLANANLGTTLQDLTPSNNSDGATICASPPDPGLVTGVQKLCIGDSSTYSVTDVLGVGFNWTVPAGWTVASGQGSNTALIKPGTDTITSYIYVQAVTTCGESSLDSIRVTPIRPVDSLSVISGDTLVCQNSDSLVYSVASVPDSVEYVWAVPADWVITSGQGTDSITVTAGALSGAITVFAQNFCGVSVISTLPVTVNPTPPLPFISPPFPGEPCVGQTGLIYTLDSLYANTQYTWSVPAGWTITAGQNTDSLTVTAGTTGGFIKVYGENSCGTGDTAFFLVTLANQVPPPPPAVSGEPLPCITFGIPYIYSIPAQSGVSTYNWTVPAAWTLVSGQQTETVTIDFGTNPSPPDTIKVSVTNGCGQSQNSTLIITPQSGPPPATDPITATPAGFPCTGQTVTYTIPDLTQASNYNWTVPADWAILSGHGTTSITVVVGSIADSVYVQTANLCGSGPTTALAVNPQQAAPNPPAFISGDIFPCVTVSSVYSADPVATANGYTWSVPPGWVIISGQGTSTITVTHGSTPGNVSVIAFNNCGTSQPAELPVQPVTGVPGSPGPIMGETAVCPGQLNLVYSVNPVPNASGYDWALPAGGVITSGQGTNTITVDNISIAGTISVTATNGCGAGPATTLPISLTTAPPDPANPITGLAVPCIGSTAVYTTTAVPGANYYIWNIPAASGWSIVSGDSTLSIIVTVGSSPINITVTPRNSCGDGLFATLQLIPSATAVPITGPIAGETFPCLSQTSLTYSIPTVQDATSYNWSAPAGWAILSGNGTSEITVSPDQTAGPVEVTVTNLCGSATVSVLVTPVPLPPANTGPISGPVTVCSGTTYTYTTPAAPNASTYTWTRPAGWNIISGQGTPTLVVRPANNAQSGQITVIASNGCGNAAIAELPVIISSRAPSLAGSITGPMKVCLNDEILTYQVPAAATATSYTWEVPTGWQVVSGQGTNTINVKPGSGDDSVSVFAENSCGRSAKINLRVVVRPVPEITEKIKTENLTCTTRRYSISPVPGTTDYYWTVPTGWVLTSGQGTNAIEVITAADTGSVTVRAQNDGCGGKVARLHVTSDIDVAIPNAFSPNGDGINEMWIIRNLENYPDNEVTVINRWGNEVFRRKNYLNDWTGKDLSAGTYYYILRVKLCNEVERTFKGYIMLVK